MGLETETYIAEFFFSTVEIPLPFGRMCIVSKLHIRKTVNRPMHLSLLLKSAELHLGGHALIPSGDEAEEANQDLSNTRRLV